MGASGVMFGAEERITLGVIGSGSRGTYVMTEFQKDMALRVGAICDVYEPNLERALGVVRKAQSEPAQAVRRYQELLADKSINAVLIATPEHWHAIPIIEACKAGKDVYCEKPLAHTVEEARLMGKVAAEMKVTLWGVRGSLASPGAETARYGGEFIRFGLQAFASGERLGDLLVQLRSAFRQLRGFAVPLFARDL